MRGMRWLWVTIGLLALLLPGQTQDNAAGALLAAGGALRADRLGIAHINSAEVNADEQRYLTALRLGAGWTRYPVYWYRIEQEAGAYTWEDYDRVIGADVAYGLNINGVLLGRPDFYAAGDAIAGLREPVFADGSDFPRPGKAINPDNPWALWVYAVVERYKPGGAYAQAQGWPEGAGVRYWEVWNEPDLPQFWQGGIAAYARLLKVAYLAAHHADPNTNIIFGGLVYPTEENWLARALALYSADPVLAANNNYFIDVVAVHSYAYPWRSGWLVLYVRETLEAYGLKRPIWLNETGVPVWDDYPGPTWAAEDTATRQRMATADQQAWFLIQSAAYAWAEGADKVFYHQLYDDCGDQGAGSDFAPHNGELCMVETACFGSAFGLYRNAANAICFSQHPTPGTPRPAAQAFRLLAEVFGSRTFSRGQVERMADVTIITFRDPTSSTLLRVIWNRKFEPVQYALPAQGSSAVLYTLAGSRPLTLDADGNYRLELKAAQADNYPRLQAGDTSAIGGEPVIIVETADGNLPPLPTSAPLAVVPASGSPTPAPSLPTLTPVDTALLTALPLLTPLPTLIVPGFEPATVSPAEDRLPPQTAIEPLPAASPATFTVRWSGKDDSGIERYIVWVQVDGAAWQPWLETARTEAIYTGVVGSSYGFAVWAVDLAGNWSENVELVAQATTTVR